MKTLKSIRLINFQSHKNTLINFAGHGHLTVITGPSDSGKSAVIRALRWVFYNVPQGDGFIFNAEDKCTVSLTYNDGTKVERIRSRGAVNRYVVNGQTLEGFGTGVPLEVQQATGIRKLEIGDQSFLLNLSEQLDGPFLGKSVSGPARAKVLGKLAGTEEIDYASKQVGTDLFRAKRQQESLEKDIEGLDKQIGQYGFIRARESAAGQAEDVLTDTRDKIAEIQKLKTLMQQWKESSDKALALTKVVVGLKEVDKGLGLIRTAQNELTKAKTLAASLGSHNEAILGSERSRATLVRLDPVFRYASPMIEKIMEKSADASKYTALYDRYDNSSISVLSLRKSVQRLSGIESVLNHLRQAFNDNVQMSAIESLCDQHERSSLCVLSIRRLVQNLSNIEHAYNHLSEAIIRKSLKIQISDLANHYEHLRLSFLTKSRVVTRLSDIDKANDHLQQAFKDNLQQFKAKESLGKRMALAQNITQSLQLFGELTEEINVTESDYLNFMSSLGKCPTCGNDIDVQKLKGVI